MENIWDALPPKWNPYSRAAWTESRSQFCPSRDGPAASTPPARLRYL